MFIFITTAILLAAVPRTMNYQGKLTNSEGVAYNGDFTMTFKLYNSESGGTELWSETHASVSISKGLFDVRLGEINPIELPFDTTYWLEIEVDGEVLSPRIKLSSVGYAYRAAIADSALNAGGTGVSSLNSLTGDLTLVGEGGITIDTSGSEIFVNLTLESGDCPNIVDLTGGSVTNQYVPTNLQTFSQSMGQFLVLGSEMGCTGGRIYRMTLYTNLTSGSIPDVDVWLDNVYIDDLSAGSIPPTGSPDAANITLSINGDGSVVIDLPHGFLYSGDNILITMRKNSTSGIGALWLGNDTSPSVNARYNESSATFPLPSTANFRPNVKFDFTAPELPDIVTNVNGITDTVNILGGTDISVDTDVPNHTITINYTGTGGGGGFQQLRANGSSWLTDSVTFVEGSNITLSQVGDSITISASGGDNWGSQVVQTTARLTGNGTFGSPLDIAQQGAITGQVLKWNGSTWAPGNDNTGTGGGITDINSQTGPSITITNGFGISVSSGSNTITITHQDMSSQSSVDNSGGTVIQDVNLDWSGHVTGLVSTDLDDRYSTGNGTANYITKWTGTRTLGNSQIYDNGTNVGIGTSSPEYKLHIQNTGGASSAKIGYSSLYTDNRLFFGDGNYVYIGELNADDRLYLRGGSISIDIGGNLGSSGQVLKSNGTTLYWADDETGGGVGEWTDAGNYVYPNENSSIRVYEDNSSYGFYYSGGATYGAYFDGGSYGVYGLYDSNRYGFIGSSSAGVEGHYIAGTPHNYGKLGTNFDGVEGYSEMTNGYGVHGTASGDATVGGFFTGPYGVYASGGTYAGYFDGDVHITGTLSKGAGSFLIDHPDDPLNKTLRHNFVESPENLCLYRGVVSLDSEGKGIVKMPDYFSSLTKENEASVQLTPIKVPFLVSYEWNDNFTAFTVIGKPNESVSYTVYAERDDPTMKILWHPVVEEKGEQSSSHCPKGKLLNPEAYGYGEDMVAEQRKIRLNKTNEMATEITPKIEESEFAPEKEIKK